MLNNISTYKFPFMLSSLTDGESKTDENLWNKWRSPEALQETIKHQHHWQN